MYIKNYKLPKTELDKYKSLNSRSKINIKVNNYYKLNLLYN